MKKRIKKGLTLKGAKIITAVITVIFMILLTNLLIDLSKDAGGAVIIYGAMGLACISCITAICWVILEQIVSKPILDLQEKNMAIHFLNKKEFTELSFTPKDDYDSDEHEMILTILEATDCRFFAQLKENDQIILIAKDDEENVLYRCEISNYYYFNKRFKKKVD